MAIGDTMKFCEWLKQKRTELGFTQAKIAEKIGAKSQSQYSLLEYDKRGPTAEELKKLQEVFGNFAGEVKLHDPKPVGWHLRKENKDKILNTLDGAEEEGPEDEDDGMGFSLQLDETTSISADRYQYKLTINNHTTYFVDFSILLKSMVAEKMRIASVSSVQEIVTKLDEIYSNIDKKFAEFDPEKFKEKREKDMQQQSLEEAH